MTSMSAAFSISREILIFKKVELTLKSTASKTEHRNDKVIVKVAYNISRFKALVNYFNVKITTDW